MTRLLVALGIFLIAWGGFVLVTGDFVATVDIAASLIASGIGVIAVSAVVKALNRIAETLAERSEQGAHQAPIRPAGERPRVIPAQPSPLELPPVAERRPQPQPVPETRPQSEPERRPASAEAGPQIIREGVIEGQRFRFFDDGSIEAEGPRGIRRYRTIDEAREQIMRDRAEPPLQNPKPAAPPEGAVRPPPRMLAEVQNHNAPGQRGAAKPPEQDLTWDAYLSGGHKPEGEPVRPTEDEQWSEPFRMLLRGDAAPPPGDPKAPKR
jgi:hypothetical protein